MPKVKLNRDPVQERNDFRRNLIESKFHFRGYRTQVDVEQALGVSGAWLSRRLRGLTDWELDDLGKLDKVLRFDANELAQLVRGKC